MIKFEYLIIDSGAFIKNVPLWEYGENLITVREVIGEIRDKDTKLWIDSMPVQLQFRDPLPRSIAFVNEFSKKTGNYQSLSLVDVKVIALTYELELEKNASSKHLRTEPLESSTPSVITYNPSSALSHNIEGFYVPSKLTSQSNEQMDENQVTLSAEQEQSSQVSAQIEDFGSHLMAEQQEQDSGCSSDDLACEETAELEQDFDRNGEEEGSDDDEGWITPSNIKSFRTNTKEDQALPVKAKAACISVDFGIQNVLKHIGLQVIGVDGRIINQVRTFILRCFACFKTTSKMTLIFCPHCGNRTLKKVSFCINPDGTRTLFISKRRPVRAKNTSIPPPKGGKHANNPLLVADQRIPQQRPTRLGRAKTNVFCDGYEAGSSPFATRDVYSRSAQLGITSSRIQRTSTDHRNPTKNTSNRRKRRR